jgi:hypothetical protein
MSDDVFAVRTTFQDVAELGQGYLERADGERMLLPLPLEVSAGEGVRFIVYLTDGTPAFAGAGRAVQVSDQGADVAAEERYETLIDGLVFDERSRPVYDYIVAVRQMAYADLGAAAEAEAAHGEEAVLESEEPTTHTEAASPALLDESMRSDRGRTDPNALVNDTISFSPREEPVPRAAPEPELEPEPESEVEYEPASSPFAAAPHNPFGAQPQAASQNFSDATPPDHNAESLAEDERARADSEIPRALDFPDPVDLANESTQIVQGRSIMPLPTGILRRPAIAVGWQPVAPKRPQPSTGSGMFRYAAGSLPIPQRPPRPDLPPDQRIQPAASPA